MIPWGEIYSAWRLMRPGQWPILSGQLAVGMLLAIGAKGPQQWSPLAVAWLCWVVFLNGGTLAFNSAYDQDTGPVAYLAEPPVPPPWLAPVATGWMLTGALLGAMVVASSFGLVLLGCTILSVLYSHPRFRLKAKPGWDLLVNVLGYGAATTTAGIISGAATTGALAQPAARLAWIITGFGFLFGSFYPLTQIYQWEEDTARGDRTLTTALGVPRVLALALALALAATAALGLGVAGLVHRGGWLLVALPLSMWVGHLAWLWLRWENKTRPTWEKAMYHGLALWALVDVGLVTAWLIQP